METHKRSIVKTIIYRISVIIILVVISWHFTADILKTSAITSTYTIAAVIFYYIHERIWTKIRWAPAIIIAGTGIGLWQVKKRN
jgi:uncharacterized membrane protein